jgi:hypothetical protein
MRVMNKVSLAAALFAGSIVLTLSAGAFAGDWDHDRDHWDRDHHYDHRRFVEERPVYVAPRPPVIVAPAPVIVAPPVYAAPPGPPSLNFNLNVPL